MVEGIDKLQWAIGGQKGPLGAPDPPNPQDWPKRGGFSITFRKFWKISGRKRDLFFDFCKNQGGYPGISRNFMKKGVLGGSLEAISGRKQEVEGFLTQKGSKWPQNGHFGGSGGPRTPLFKGP